MTVKEQVDAAKAMSFHDCCRVVYEDNKHCSGGNVAYAATYAKAGLDMLEGSEAAKVQANYVVSNLAGWRHPDAAMIRARLKQIGKGA